MVFGSDITLTCTLEINSAIVASDLSLLMVDVQLFRDGTALTLTGPAMANTTFNYTIQLNSFSITDVGNYTCNATIRPMMSSTYITGNEILESDTIQVTTGEIFP